MSRRDTDPLLRGTLELLLLQSLARGPLHGYAIARRIEQETSDRLSVEEGSLYPALHRLEDLGYVTAAWSGRRKERRVRVYRLTRTGRVRLDSQRRAWATFARAVTRMIGSR